MAAFWRQNSSFYQKYLFHTLAYYNSHPDIKAYLEIILSLVTVIILGVFAIKPTLTTIAELNAEVQQKEQTDATLDQKISSLSTAQQNLNNNQSTLVLLDTAVPTSPMLQDYIKQLEALAIQNGVTIQNLQVDQVALVGTPIAISPAQEQTPEEATASAIPAGASEIFLIISISGAYPNLAGFLENIEDHRRPITIDSITSNSLDSETEGSTIQLTITGKIPYFYIPRINEEE